MEITKNHKNLQLDRIHRDRENMEFSCVKFDILIFTCMHGNKFLVALLWSLKLSAWMIKIHNWMITCWILHQFRRIVALTMCNVTCHTTFPLTCRFRCVRCSWFLQWRQRLPRSTQAVYDVMSPAQWRHARSKRKGKGQFLFIHWCDDDMAADSFHIAAKNGHMLEWSSW